MGYLNTSFKMLLDILGSSGRVWMGVLLTFSVVSFFAEALALLILYALVAANDISVLAENKAIGFIFHVLRIDEQEISLLLLGGIFVSCVLLRFGYQALSGWYGVQFSLRMSTRILDQYVRRNVRAISEKKSEILSDVGARVETLAGEFVMAWFNIFYTITLIVMALIVGAVSIGFELFAVIAGLVAISGSVFFGLRNVIKDYGQKIQALQTTLMDSLLIIVMALKELKANRFLGHAEVGYVNNLRQLRVVKYVLSLLQASNRFVLEVIFFTVALVIYYRSLTYADVDETKLVAALSALGLGLYRIAPLINSLFSSVLSINAAHPTVSYIAEAYDVKDVLNNSKLLERESESLLNGSLSSDRLCSGTFKLENDSFDQFNFELGKHYFIEGNSGVGKTTLVEALMGLNQVWKVKYISELGCNLSTIKFSYMEGRAKILGGDLRFNIQSFNDYDDERMKHIMSLVGLHEILADSKLTLQCAIGHDGDVALSQGQKQRIGLARALYRNADVYVLDEPVSNLDYPSAADLLARIRAYLKGKTLLVISHTSEFRGMFDDCIVLQKHKA